MTKSKTELINVTINFDYCLKPKTKIYINDNLVETFVPETNTIVFSTEVKDKWSLQICHYDKNYSKDNDEYIEIKDILLNDVSIGSMIWNTTQIPSDITSEEYSKYIWQGNLYLGHNGSCTWWFESPVEKMLRNFYSTNVNNTMRSQETTQKTLDYMKKKFKIN